MINSVEEYFKRKTENISFIQLKPEANVVINGYKIPSTLPLPLLIDELIAEIKEKKAQEELKIKSIINGIIYILAADPEFKHIDEYRKILYSYSENIEDFILYNGLNFISEDKLEDAMVYFRALVNLNSDNLDGLYNYGLALEEKARKLYKNKNEKIGNMFFKESTKYFENIIDIFPDYSLAYYKLGFHYMVNKQFKKCQIIWEKFLEIDKDNDRIDEIKQNLLKIEDDIKYEEGYTEILRGNSEKGLEKLLPLKEKYSDWWNLIFMIGLGYRQLGEYEKAKSEFENVLAINPGQIDTLNELGLCLAALGQYEKAIDRFTEAIHKKPEDYEIICNRGMTYLQMGNISKAIEDIDKAYEMNHNDEITIKCKIEIEKLRKNI